MKELVVISGKGGTGKTSLVAAFARLAGRAALADCDVDAADLHLVVRANDREEHPFSGGKVARVIDERCTGCDRCREVCRFAAISADPYRVDPVRCEGCGLCVRLCPSEAIAFDAVVNGAWYVADTPFGPLVHARLRPAEENSGKLVTVVRNEARRLATEQGLDLVLVDGSPGIGCPVIASLAGASLALVVTEPTLSGQHDLGRVLELCRHFRLPVAVCVNKWDLNPELAGEIEREALAKGARFVQRVGYDRLFTAAQIAGDSVLDAAGARATEAIATGRRAPQTAARASSSADGAPRDEAANVISAKAATPDVATPDVATPDVAGEVRRLWQALREALDGAAADSAVR